MHQLPLENYPPAVNGLRILNQIEGFELCAWSSAKNERVPNDDVAFMEVRRPEYPGVTCGSLKRLFKFLRWHFRVGRDLARWKPDVIFSIEPHSALAVWIYYCFYGGKANLLVHHHEYYSRADYRRPGNRTLRINHFFEVRFLLQRAGWVSQTNRERLGMMRKDYASVTAAKANIWPNYPPCDWGKGSERQVVDETEERSEVTLRLLCVGSLSFEDTFIREVVEWVKRSAPKVSLHICGHNVKVEVWRWIESLGVNHITMNQSGCAYDRLPAVLSQFDVGLVLYKGNTQNFVYNVPNKVMEFLYCGLEVWFPPEMKGMRLFREENDGLALREVDFKRMDNFEIGSLGRSELDRERFSAESAMAPVIDFLRESA